MEIVFLVNIRKQKPVIDVKLLKTLNATLLLLLCVFSDELTRKSNLTVKNKTINTLLSVGIVSLTEDPRFAFTSHCSLDPLMW